MSIPALTRSGTARTLPNHGTASAYIRARVPFLSGNLTGHNRPQWGIGSLPRDWSTLFHADADAIDYVVYSYSTPIAWHTPQGWTVPRVSYSITTSVKHMGPVWHGIDYGKGQRVRTRIDAVRVVGLDRLKASVNGNPRFDVTFSDGSRALTSSDASVSYDAENKLRSGERLYVDYTPAGRIRSWTVAPADNFTER